MRIGIAATRAFLLVVSGSLLSAATALAQGTITGKVATRSTGAPLADARIVIVGSTLGATTGADGRYTIKGVRAGSVTIRAIRLGYEESKKVVQVTGDAESTVDFGLNPAVQSLPGVVTTATGQERRIEVGNSIGNISASKKVEETPIHNMGDLLLGKVPGLVVQAAAMTGGANAIRIRGLNSLSRSNAPIYVIDGIRFDGTNGGLSVGGTTASRLNDISPEEIENVEVVRGPSAATLYGTDAANGVIVITTKRGRAGRAKWSFSTEQGSIQDKNPYPTTYALWGHNSLTNAQARCTLINLGGTPLVASTGATCVKDSLTAFNILRTDGLSPIGDGNRQLYTLQVGGGADQIRYFVSGTLEGERGPISMPSKDLAALNAAKIKTQDEWLHPENLARGSFRANINAAVSPQFDMNVNVGFIRSEQRLPNVDNNVNSLYFQGYTGPGFKPGANCSVATPCLGYTNVGNLGQALNGWASFTPAEMMQRVSVEGVKRFIGGSTMSYRPLSWLQTDGTIGLDFQSQRNFFLCRLNECPNFGTQRLGRSEDDHQNNRILTTNLRATATYQAMRDLNLKTTLGGDYNNSQIEASNSIGSILPPGAQRPSDGATPSVANSTLPSATKTLGYYLQEEFAWRDRLFVTTAVRSDQNTAFGTKYAGVYYPKVQASWLATDEPFMPKIPMIDGIRLRAAYGSSGVQPGATSALKTFSSTTTSIANTDVAALVSNQLGNTKLKPELTTEFETGADIEGWNRRVRLELTYYSKMTSDALVNQTIGGSAGAAVTSILRNLGKVKNSGAEALLTVQAVDMEQVGVDLTLSASHNDNKVVTLGLDDAGRAIPTIGTTTRVQAGYPLNTFFLVRYGYTDANNDGFITQNEMTLNPLDTVVKGPAYAPDAASLSLGVDLLKRALRLNTQFDHRGGHTLFNNLQGFLCANASSNEEVSLPGTAIWRQARCVAARYGINNVVSGSTVNTKTNYGYYESGRFIRLRELSATYQIPANFSAKYMRADNVSISLGARNLKVWTKYTGEDPEANYASGSGGNNGGDVPLDLLTTGPRRYFTARLNVQF